MKARQEKAKLAVTSSKPYQKVNIPVTTPIYYNFNRKILRIQLICIKMIFCLNTFFIPISVNFCGQNCMENYLTKLNGNFVKIAALSLLQV